MDKLPLTPEEEWFRRVVLIVASIIGLGLVFGIAMNADDPARALMLTGGVLALLLLMRIAYLLSAILKELRTENWHREAQRRFGDGDARPELGRGHDIDR